jgi:hypothetical protein
MRADVTAVLRRVSADYIRSRRAAGELRTRLVSVAHERTRLVDNIPPESLGERAQSRLAEIERVRGTLERSARAADERVRAVEAVIAAIVIATGDAGPAPVPSAPEEIESAPADESWVQAAGPTDPTVRGGWTPPAT